MPTSVPQIEIADDADPPGGGRKNRKGDSAHPIENDRMGAELFIEIEVRAFTEQIEIEVGEYGRKRLV